MTDSRKAPHCGALLARGARLRAPLFILYQNRTGKFSVCSSNRRGEFGFKRRSTAALFLTRLYALPFSESRTNRFTSGNTVEHFVLCKGGGFPAKEMRKAVAGFVGEQPNAMLALSAEERFFLSALRRYRFVDSEKSICYYFGNESY